MRFRGEAVAAVVGEATAIESLDLSRFPVAWEPLAVLSEMSDALSGEAPRLHAHRPGNVLVRGRVVRGDVEAAFAEDGIVVAEGIFETGFVEHAAIEPEAGLPAGSATASRSRPRRNRPTSTATRSPRSSAFRRTTCASCRPRSAAASARKLDLSVQPFVAVAAWVMNRPVRMVYSRRESMMVTTKRHPSRIAMRVAARRDGTLLAVDVKADFNTGAYASWGPTVANRVPVHASGSLSRAALPRRGAGDPHPSRAGRRLPRLRRAAGGDRAGAALRRARRPARARPARIPDRERPDDRDADGHRPDSRRRRRHQGLP